MKKETSNENKSDKFIRLAEHRVNEALKKIRLISNLANTNNYDYTENQVNEIVGVLETEIRNLKTAYKQELDRKENAFKFKNK